MTKWNIDRGKKITGGRVNLNRKKKKYMRGSLPLLTILGPTKKKIDRVLAGQERVRLVKAEYVNALNPKTNKAKKTKILNVIEHADNPHYTRRGIITKGSVVRTELGLVRITSRPSQHGVLNGILVEEKPK